jgi:putative ABC transport system permease protein
MTNLLLPGRADRALTRELRSHLAFLEDEYRRRGLSSEEARRSAVHALGGVEQTKELHRDSRSFTWVGDTRRDVVYAVRMFRRRPVTAATAILSLGLGMGLNAAVFTVVDWVLLRPLPYASPQQLVRVFTAGTAPATGLAALTPSEFRAFAGAASLRASAAFSTATRVLAGSNIEPVHATVARGDGDLFGTLGIVPVLGRSFRAEEFAAGAPVVVLSNELWRRQFHEDISLVGATVTIDGVAHTVVGVAPPNRRYPSEADLWRPLTAREKEGSDRELVMIARLWENVPIARANAELATLARAASSGARTAWADEVQRTDVKNVRAALNALFASTLLVLLIVCANVAALLGACASDRAGEMAVRGALGASRRQLLLQLTTEVLVTALTGGLVGILFGRVALRVLVAAAPVSVPRLSEITMDTPVFAASLAVTVVIGLCVGLGPAVRLSRSSGSGAFRPAGWNRATRTSRTRRVLVVGQVALAVMLTVGAGLLARSLRNLISVNNGFDVDHIVAVDLDLRGSRTGDSRPLFHELIAASETLPGVRSAAVSLQLPTQLAGLRAQVRSVGGPDVHSTAVLRPITSQYFDALGVGMTGGRSFAGTDTATAPYVAIVNAAFVRDILGGGAALGTRLTTPLVKAPLTVVGTVADISPAGESDRPALYVSADQVVAGAGFLLVRVQGDPRAALSVLASRVREVAPRLPIDRVRPLADVLEPGRAMTRFNTRLITTFAALALLLSAIGVYGLTAGEVAARWHEIAVRMALGASPRGVLWTVIRPCAGVIVAGSAAGIAGALAVVAPLLASLLHGVSPVDRSILATAPAVLISVGILAAVLASARVLWAAPAETLRSD